LIIALDISIVSWLASQVSFDLITKADVEAVVPYLIGHWEVVELIPHPALGEIEVITEQRPGRMVGFHELCWCESC
tara:strand:- start:566 stop:793 length:228 start_codon:yes stop_codon:yes gene_type:complete